MYGAGRLYAYMRSKGHDVSFKDHNQNAFFSLLSKDHLNRAYDNLKIMIDPVMRSTVLRDDIGSILLNNSEYALKGLISKIFVSDKKWLKHLSDFPMTGNIIGSVVRSRITKENILYSLLSAGKDVIADVDTSCGVMNKEFFSLDPAEFMRHFMVLLCGKALIDAAYFPALLDFGFGMNGTAYSPCTPDIIRAVADERHNFLLPYYREHVLPDMEKDRPGLLGISITHTSEFVPAFTLANMVKKHFPDIHVCLGGAALTEVAYRIEKNKKLWEFFDSMILGPGEEINRLK